MRILLVNKFFYRKGGSETYYFALGEALKAAGHDVIWFSMTHPENLPCDQARYFVDHVDYNAPESALKKFAHAISAIYSREAKRKFRQLLLDEKPDIVHINNVHKQITLSILDPCIKYNIPVIATSHDWIFVCPNYQKLRDGTVCELCQDGDIWNCFKTGCVQGSKLRSLLATIESGFYKRNGSYDKINTYIAPSICMAEKMKASNFTKSPVVHLRNFLIDLDLPISGSADPPYYIYLGRLVEEKGVRTLIRAYAKSAVEPELYILGEGPLKEELEREISDLGISGKAHLLGAKYGDELISITSRSLALILPSEIMENCPYSIMEAYAMGKPVIGSRIGGIPELIVEGETGFCYETGNADDLAERLRDIAAMPENNYHMMTIASRRYAVENFSRDKYIENLVECYESLIAR